MKKVYNLQLPNGREPFGEWLAKLDLKSRATIRAYIDRVATGGGRKNVRVLGEGVFEIKIKYGP